MTPWLIEVTVPATAERAAEHVAVRTEAEYAWQAIASVSRKGLLPPGPCTITVSVENASRS